ncbi:tetratricopeptide repeat protein 33-like isoform X2 [Xenia sp. Carnegie-2017]|uniref:tetratricopeptide repeat protein 33-like isoform X2 n=1 Tax=Xenia sp. Carnegie-2017 TaxID=2897299 RepID=UPI001F0372B0|nr:tetratricopeptide repeat protein 33-like isoform X2 [Xenia sp. Carnegie-2017]
MAASKTFIWKRRCKTSPNLSHASFTVEEDEEPFVEDWRTLAKKPKCVSLEDAIAKSTRLKNEGIELAELQRYWESITKWNEAIELTPENEVLHEMKAQVFLELNEIFPAVQAAEKAVSINPRCHNSFQTLGRAQLAMGEIQMAILSFSRAFHIKPDSSELLNEDLLWSCELRRRKIEIERSSVMRAAEQ